MSPRVRKIIFSHGLTGFICWYGIEKIFQKTIGISVLEVSIMAITYVAISALMNVPTGILADRKGRRFAIVVATILLLLSTLTAGLSDNIWQYLVSIVLWGLFYTTQNGAYEAILYDTLKEEGREHEYARASGLSIAAFFGAIFVSSVLGAWIGDEFSLRTAYFITLIPNVFNIFVAMSLHEPHRKHEDGGSFAMAFKGFRFLKSSRNVVLLAGMWLLISLMSWTTNEFGQLFFIELGFGVFIVGILNAFSGLFQAAGSFLGHRFKLLSLRYTGPLLVLFLAFIFLLPISLRVISVSLFLLFVILRQVLYISTDTALQHTLPSSIRATTLSSLGMLNDGLLVISYAGFGLVSQHTTIRKGYITIAGLGIALIAATWLLARRVKRTTSGIYKVEPDELVPDADSIPR